MFQSTLLTAPPWAAAAKAASMPRAAEVAVVRAIFNCFGIRSSNPALGSTCFFSSTSVCISYNPLHWPSSYNPIIINVSNRFGELFLEDLSVFMFPISMSDSLETLSSSAFHISDSLKAQGRYDTYWHILTRVMYDTSTPNLQFPYFPFPVLSNLYLSGWSYRQGHWSSSPMKCDGRS